LNYQKPKTLLTALHWASFNNDRPVVQLLLDGFYSMEAAGSSKKAKEHSLAQLTEAEAKSSYEKGAKL